MNFEFDSNNALILKEKSSRGQAASKQHKLKSIFAQEIFNIIQQDNSSGENIIDRTFVKQFLEVVQDMIGDQIEYIKTSSCDSLDGRSKRATRLYEFSELLKDIL